jgi:hypothetical protein
MSCAVNLQVTEGKGSFKVGEERKRKKLRVEREKEVEDKEEENQNNRSYKAELS